MQCPCVRGFFRVSHGSGVAWRPNPLQRAELELALSDLFGFPSSYSRNEYPYGHHLDAVMGTCDFQMFDEDFLRTMIDRTVDNLRGVREQARANLPSRQAIRAYLRTLPAETLQTVEPWLPHGMTAQHLLSVIVAGTDDDLRALARSLLSNRSFVQHLISGASEAPFDDFNRALPARGFRWSRQTALTVLAGTQEEKR